MPVVGVGIDVVEIDRFQASLDRTPGLRDRLFTRDERDRPPASLAARFAAKEAVAKALGTGFRDGVGPSQIEVVHDARGGPGVRLHGAAAACAAARGQARLWLSISDERDYAVAYALLESVAA